MNALNSRYEHLLHKAQDAKRGGRDAWAVQSTGEKVAVALVLNRSDWLSECGYTIAEAIERAGQEWASMIPQVARQLTDEEGA
jgi:hypothetical protein